MMDDNKPEECKVCFNNYDEELRRPRTLPCGHTFCSQCIEDTMMNVQLTCPNCRAEHSATAATQFPICYGMEAFIKKFKSMQVTSVGAVSAKPGQDHTRGISKKLRSMVQEHKSSINNLISECEEVLSQLGKYQEQMRDWKTQHHQLQDRLYDLMEKNMAAIVLLEQEDASVVNMTTEGEAGKKQLQTMLECLDTVNTAQEVVTTIDETDQYNVEAEDWIQKCQEIFPDVNTVCTSVKVQETIKKALDMTTGIGATAVPILPEDSGSTIMEKVERITYKIPPTLREFILHSRFVREQTFGCVRFPPLPRAQRGVMHRPPPPPPLRLLLPKTGEAVATVAATAKQEEEDNDNDDYLLMAPRSSP